MGLIDETFCDKWQAKIDELKRRIFTELVTPDGKPRPGVTKEQLREAIETVKQVSAMQDRAIAEHSELAEEVRGAQEQVANTRNFLKEQERKWGIKFGPFVSSMYRLR